MRVQPGFEYCDSYKIESAEKETAVEVVPGATWSKRV